MPLRGKGGISSLFKGLQYRAKKKGFEKKTGRVVQPFYQPLSSSYFFVSFKENSTKSYLSIYGKL